MPSFDALTFAELFRNHLQTSQEILALLQQERLSLEENRLDDFAAITEQKPDILNQLSQTDIEIFSALQQAGCAEDTDGIKGFLTSIDPAARHQLLTLWENILELTEQCQRANSTNGKIIDACRKDAEQVLDILLGRSQQVELYESSGRAIKNRSNNFVKV